MKTTEQSLILKYRPDKFDQVVGQDDIVESLQATLDERRGRSFILTGPSGVGKTTIARVAAKYVGTNEGNITEVAAAIFNGVDDMRALSATLAYRPLALRGATSKVIIIDEAHRVTQPAFDAILKDVEEPPEWAYWFFCTTDIGKIPATIRSRCAVYTLKPIPFNTIFGYLEAIVEKEEFTCPRAVLQLCTREAGGNLRKALSFLAMCADVPDRQEAVRLILEGEAELAGSGFALAQALAKGSSWATIQPLLAKLTGEDEEKDEETRKIKKEQRELEPRETAEGVRQTIRAYFTKVIVNSKDEKTAANALRILDLFSEPCNPADGFSPIVLAVGRALFTR